MVRRGVVLKCEAVCDVGGGEVIEQWEYHMKIWLLSFSSKSLIGSTEVIAV